MRTKCTKILNVSTRFSCEYFALEDFVAVFRKNLDEEILSSKKNLNASKTF